MSWRWVSVVGTVVSRGEWLVEHRFAMDRGEAEWLAELAGFDRDQGWALDGLFSCVDWLVWRARMARPTAYEKLHVARQLSRRPILFEAFSQGRLSYSAVRALCRVDDPSPDVERSLVDLAEAATGADVERAVRFYQLHADQHRPPADPATRRELRVRREPDGMWTFEVTVDDLEAEEVMGALRAAIDRPAATTPGSADDYADAESGLSYPARRADAFMALIRTGLRHLEAGTPGGADRYMVHLVRHGDGPATLVDGTPLEPAVAAALACDCSTVEHLVVGGEPLALGRRRREWNTAQRRAILVRDRATCRFPGCFRRVGDVHHVRWWERGGGTDVANGLLICTRHHSLLHAGYEAEGDANGPVLFRRPGGSPIGYG